jgi:PAS domain S-box-containing protein
MYGKGREQKMKGTDIIRKDYYVIIVGFSLGVFYWVVDSFLDTFWSGKTFIEMLLHPGSGIVFYRSFIAFLFIWFSVYVRYIVTKRKQAEKTLKESEEKYRALMNEAGDAIVLADTNGNLLEVNKKAEELLSYTKEELLNMNIAQIHPKEELEKTIAAFKVSAPLNDGKVLRKDGKIVPVDITGSAIEYAGKKVIQGIFRDITEQKRTEEELREAQKRFEDVLNSLDSLVYVIEMNTYEVLFINEYGKDNWGNIEGKICWQTLQKNQSAPCEFCTNKRLTTPDGKPSETVVWEFQNTVNQRWYECHDKAIYWPNRRLVRIEIAADITERKRTEEKIKASLNEKEVLLREIHHRVKNNMQIISSLLKLQAGYIEDKKYLEMFKESQNRILTMSLVYEKLYRSKDFTKINFKEYIHNLANGVFQSYSGRSSNILLNLNIENVELGIDSAIPCGLIINELVTNSLKYAFPGEIKGEIKIVLGKIDGNEYELTVSDNGIGIPQDLDFRKTETLGLHLVSMLTEDQLSGKIDLDRSRGTEFIIRFGDGK